MELLITIIWVGAVLAMVFLISKVAVKRPVEKRPAEILQQMEIIIPKVNPPANDPTASWSQFYKIDICPKCKHRLEADKARYKSRCCYLCGYSNGSLFTCETVTVRDRYVNGKYEGTYIHE